MRQKPWQLIAAALIAAEQFGRKTPVTILRHPQFEGSDPGDQGPALIAAAVGQARFRPARPWQRRADWRDCAGIVLSSIMRRDETRAARFY
jgi:hypothetical protein